MPVLQGFLCSAFFDLRNIVHLIFIALSILRGVLLFSIKFSKKPLTKALNSDILITEPFVHFQDNLERHAEATALLQ